MWVILGARSVVVAITERVRSTDRAIRCADLAQAGVHRAGGVMRYALQSEVPFARERESRTSERSCLIRATARSRSRTDHPGACRGRCGPAKVIRIAAIPAGRRRSYPACQNERGDRTNRGAVISLLVPLPQLPSRRPIWWRSVRSVAVVRSTYTSLMPGRERRSLSGEHAVDDV
jgi:hypothetical protein